MFWFQLKRDAVSLLAMLLKVARKTSIRPSIEFEEYVNDYRALHWDYAFVDQIEAKEINKSWKWSNPKNVHGVPVCQRLIYRYWSHVLLKEQVVKSQSSSFLTWFDTTMKDTMFTDVQIKAWDLPHLRQCHWYIEMSLKETPPHEEQNRCQVQPNFCAPPPATVAPLVKGKGKSTLETKSKTGGASDSKPEAATKSRKRDGGPATRETSKRKKTTDAKSDVVIALVDQVAESEAKLSKSGGQILRGLTTGNSAAQRSQLINRSSRFLPKHFSSIEACLKYSQDQTGTNFTPQSHRFGTDYKFIQFCSSLGIANFFDYFDFFLDRPINDQEQDI